MKPRRRRTPDPSQRPAYGQGVRAAVEALGRDAIATPGPNSDETDNPVTGKTEEQFVSSGA